MYDEELLQQEHSKERHESAECPVCKSDTFLQPDLKLLVSPCYHKMYTVSSAHSLFKD